MSSIRVLQDKETAVKIGEFLTGPDAFEQTWAPNEKTCVKQAVLDSLDGKNHRYWYVENAGQIIAALGVRENKLGSGGYEMDSDYVAVHKDFRRRGIANELLKAMEKYVTENNGRYIHIVTCDIPSYQPANQFYESNNYTRVAEMPDYFVPGEGRIDYYKLFQTETSTLT
jgi:ribosomal protein S18 acetylase RimI-like enzyme